MTSERLLKEALSLPVEERAFIADSLLRSLNAPDDAIEAKRVEVAKRRCVELLTGRVKPVPRDEVFSEIAKRFAK